MPRYAQLVMGPAGSGKSTYCSTMVQHAESLNRSVQVVNLDPAAEYFSYPVMADIRELIQVDDVMEDDSLRFGPNGGLVFCMEYFANNFDWLAESLGHVEDDYVLFDCPGKCSAVQNARQRHYIYLYCMGLQTEVHLLMKLSLCSKRGAAVLELEV
uniref:GPN-loop GTPase 3 n=1 Tax=Fundulus heteroclitus TaxID=8078 RepID=A0A3Q2PX45_FUNHE